MYKMTLLTWLENNRAINLYVSRITSWLHPQVLLSQHGANDQGDLVADLIVFAEFEPHYL